jgi:transposase
MENTIGIDVSKAKLDVHVLKEKRDIQFDNSATGIKECIELCLEVKPELIAMEATGGYEYFAAAGLCAEGFAVIAAMRKLLCIMNAMLKNNQQWEPKIV